MNDELNDLPGPTLHAYVETRFTLLNEEMKGLKLHIDRAFTESDLRYQQRFDAQAKALEAAFQTAKEAVQAALSAADRAVSKAELAADKRFESVNEFRKTLDDQQRTLMPRSEVQVTVQRLEEKLLSLQKTVDSNQDERRGIKGGWGYAVGVVGLIATLLVIATFVINRAPAATPQVIYVPAPAGALLPTTPPQPTPR